MKFAKDEKYSVPKTFPILEHWYTRSNKQTRTNQTMKHHGLVLRQRTKQAQKLPFDLEAKMKFQKYIIDKRKMNSFELYHIIKNMDETLMCFDPPKNKAVNYRG